MSRVLFIITQSEIGGAQRFLLEFAPYLVSRGHEVIVAAGEGDGELFEKLSIFNFQLSIKTCRVSNLIRSLNPVKDCLALYALIKVIKKEKPNVLFLQSTKAGFLGSLAAKLCNLTAKSYKLKAIYRIGGWAFNDPRPWWMNQIVFWMEKISARWKDVIIVNSEYDKKLAIEKNIAPANKIVKIYNGIDPEKMAFLTREEARKKFPIPNSQFPVKPQDQIPKQIKIIGTLANLYATKGIDHLIEAANILTKSYQLTAINYIVIGEGPKRTKLEALIEKYNLHDKFFLIGRLPNAAQYLKAFDIFVLSSVKEGFPWVLLEAMAAETPIIATKVGAVPEVIEDGKDGLLVPPKDPGVLAQKISYLISMHNTHDREYYAINAKGTLTQFSLQKMLEESERICNLT